MVVWNELYLPMYSQSKHIFMPNMMAQVIYLKQKHNTANRIYRQVFQNCLKNILTLLPSIQAKN